MKFNEEPINTVRNNSIELIERVKKIIEEKNKISRKEWKEVKKIIEDS